MTRSSPHRPFQTLPRGILALAILVGATEALFSVGEMNLGLAPDEAQWRVLAILQHGLLPEQLAIDVVQNRPLLATLSRFLTYPYIGYDIIDSLISVVFLLAIGNFASRFLGQVRVLAIFLIATLVGGMGYLLFYSGDYPLIGPSSGLFGLFGSLLALAIMPIEIPRETRANLFRLPLLMLALQIVLGILFSSHFVWIAILIGFITGFITAILITIGVRDGFRLLAALLLGNRRD